MCILLVQDTTEASKYLKQPMSLIARRVYGEPGTLYARCGGVFGISAFVDRCMDKWMACDTLNRNAMVARWHQSAQRPGFKFLVVQCVNAILTRSPRLAPTLFLC